MLFGIDEICCGVPQEEVKSVINKLLSDHDPKGTGCITQEEFLIWTLNDSLTTTFLKIIFQVSYYCSIVASIYPKYNHLVLNLGCLATCKNLKIRENENHSGKSWKNQGK